jgi:hypothetical protein
MEKRDGLRFMTGKPEGKKSLGRPRSRLADIIKIDVEEI